MEYLEQGIDSFIASSIPDDFSEWVDTTTYIREFDEENLTDASTVRYGNYYFRSITDDNLGNNPEETLGIYWVRWNVSNKYALIDLRATTASTSSVGTDIVTNGAFDTETDWSLGSLWTWGTGVVISGGSADATVNQDVGLMPNTSYTITVEISSYTSGELYAGYFQGGGGGIVKATTAMTSTGIFTFTFTTSIELTTNKIYLQSGNPEVFIGEVTEVTLKDAGDIVVTFAKDVIDTIAIGYYSAETLRIELLDASEEIIWSVEETQSPNEDVEDYYTYIYSLYTTEVDRAKVYKLPTGLGVNIRITMTPIGTTDTASCGYLIGGTAVSMGETLYGVDFSFESYSVKTTDAFGITTIIKRGIQDLVDFETVIDAASMANIKRKVKTIYGEVLAFIVDPTEDSRYDNLVTLGTVDNVSVTLDNPVQSIMSWSIQEII